MTMHIHTILTYHSWACSDSHYRNEELYPSDVSLLFLGLMVYTVTKLTTIAPDLGQDPL